MCHHNTSPDPPFTLVITSPPNASLQPRVLHARTLFNTHTSSTQLSSYAGAVDYSAADAAAISTRLELITKLARRFKCASRGAAGLLELQKQWRRQLQQYYDSQGQAEVWREEVGELQGRVGRLAVELSAARVAAAGRLAAAVQVSRQAGDDWEQAA